MAQVSNSKRILFATLGSLGDLHPCLALGSALMERGHTVTIATTEFYRPKVEALGFNFHPIRRNWDPTDTSLIAQCAELKKGPEILIRKLVLPHLRDTYDDLLQAAQHCDLMLAGELVYAAPLVAEKLHLRWASLTLSPCSFLSAYDPSLLVNVPSLIHLRRLGVRAYRMAFDLGRFATRHWWDPVRQLRAAEGLRTACDPLTRDKFSPELALALFSECLAKSQPDWPAHTVQPGFVFFHEKPADSATHAKLTGFLNAGDPPIVFTLGSTAVHFPGDFYRSSMDAAQRLQQRALLIGATTVPQRIGDAILSVPYAPYSEVFPRASVIVHQGGSGTTAQALRAGRPMLIVPFGWDQPDNGVRAERLGVAFSLSRSEYSSGGAVEALRRLLGEPSFNANAEKAAARVRSETGIETAISSIERLLQD